MRLLTILSMMVAVCIAGRMVTRTEAATTRGDNHSVNIQTIDPSDMMRSIVELPI